jgi:hypothetical protein
VNVIAIGDGVREQTEREAADVLAIWIDGLDQFTEALDMLRGVAWQKPDEDQEPVLMSLLAHAFQTQVAGYRLAIAGHYGPSLALVRLCVEYMLAWWFAWREPGQAPRFIRQSAKPTPDWNELVQAHENALGERDQELRIWRKHLNPVAHVDRQQAGYVWTDGEQPGLRMAPEFDRGLLIGAAGLFSEVIPFLLECIELMRRKYGLEPPDPERAAAFHARLKAWIAAIPDKP